MEGMEGVEGWGVRSATVEIMEGVEKLADWDHAGRRHASRKRSSASR